MRVSGTGACGPWIAAAAVLLFSVAAPAAPPDAPAGPGAVSRRPAASDPLAALARERGGVVIADFGLGMCRQCKAQAAILDEVARVYGAKVVIRMVAVNKEQALTERYGVETIPHLVFLDPSGAVRFRRTGVTDFGEIAAQLRRMGVAP